MRFIENIIPLTIAIIVIVSVIRVFIKQYKQLTKPNKEYEDFLKKYDIEKPEDYYKKRNEKE